MVLKYIIIFICAGIFAYFANQAFQGNFSGGEVVKAWLW